MSAPSKVEPGANKLPRDFAYINSRKKRPSEYEAVNLHVQPRLGNWWDKGNSYLRTPEGREAFVIDSTRLRHPDWHDFRDPSSLWQRQYMRMQAEQERAIDRLTEDIAPDAAAEIDPTWLTEILQNHYSVWSFVEYGLFRGMFSASREGLSDTVVASMLFETFDRARHSQDIVHYLLMLEENVPGFDAIGAKDAWLESPRYQPLRRLVEEISFGVKDWGETIVAMNLCFDPIVSEVAVLRLVGALGPIHGDVVSKLILSSVERDRRRELAWASEFVTMVTGPDIPAAAENRAIIAEWIAHWTPKAIEAVAPFAELYDCLPAAKTPFAEVLATAVAKQRDIVTALGVGGSA
jgi:methane monooxygenase component A beta chain/propane monooxygenase small subunit